MRSVTLDLEEYAKIEIIHGAEALRVVLKTNFSHNEFVIQSKNLQDFLTKAQILVNEFNERMESIEGGKW